MQWLSGLYYADFISFYSPTQLDHSSFFFVGLEGIDQQERQLLQLQSESSLPSPFLEAGLLSEDGTALHSLGLLRKIGSMKHWYPSYETLIH